MRLTSRPKNDQRLGWILWSWEQCFQERSIATNMNALERTYLDLSIRVTIQRHCKPRIGKIHSNIVHRKPRILFTPRRKGMIYADRQFKRSHTLTACVQKKTQRTYGRNSVRKLFARHIQPFCSLRATSGHFEFCAAHKANSSGLAALIGTSPFPRRSHQNSFIFTTSHVLLHSKYAT